MSTFGLDLSWPERCGLGRDLLGITKRLKSWLGKYLLRTSQSVILDKCPIETKFNSTVAVATSSSAPPPPPLYLLSGGIIH
ncbi:hypothetical protein L1887_09347 [Cichorium endivia]|nr:hypothetical protein L1887_09347 [Cichorium endivia]